MMVEVIYILNAQNNRRFNFETIIHKNLENRTKTSKDKGKYVKRTKQKSCPFIFEIPRNNRKYNFDTDIQNKFEIEPKIPKIWGNM